MLETVREKWSGLDILINNAALLASRYSAPFVDTALGDIRAVLDVNIMGVIHCTLAARPLMVNREGVIINISSLAGYQVNGAYGLTKLAVRGLTVAFARELAADRIRVNAVAPGYTATETGLAEMDPGLAADFIDNLQLVHRVGQPQDIVEATLFLCSSRASFITGETLRVTGGYPLTL
jgi:NAD(P)-dependent dehydrogenase (short-subunit alcohol dehydrogenase family)